MYQNTSKHIRTCRNTSKHVRMRQNMSKCLLTQFCLILTHFWPIFTHKKPLLMNFDVYRLVLSTFDVNLAPLWPVLSCFSSSTTHVLSILIHFRPRFADFDQLLAQFCSVLMSKHVRTCINPILANSNQLLTYFCSQWATFDQFWCICSCVEHPWHHFGTTLASFFLFYHI